MSEPEFPEVDESGEAELSSVQAEDGTDEGESVEDESVEDESVEDESVEDESLEDESLEDESLEDETSAGADGVDGEHEDGEGTSPDLDESASEAAEGETELSLAAVLDEEVVETPEWLPDVVEALIFCAPEPIGVSRIREVLKEEEVDVDAKQVKSALKALTAKWNDPDRTHGRSFTLSEISGAWAFRTVPTVGQYLRRFFQARPQRLSKAALETLAIIAYRQPVTRPQVDDIRGVDCSGAIKNLLDRRLIRVLGKADDIGRPLIYGTTRGFLDFFDLKSLSDLPTLRELHELQDGGAAPAPEPVEALGPVTVMDLFDPGKPAEMVSRETEEEGETALRALEEALGEAATVTRRAQRVADGDMDVPDDFAPTGREFLDEEEDEDASPRPHADLTERAHPRKPRPVDEDDAQATGEDDPPVPEEDDVQAPAEAQVEPLDEDEAQAAHEEEAEAFGEGEAEAADEAGESDADSEDEARASDDPEPEVVPEEEAHAPDEDEPLAPDEGEPYAEPDDEPPPEDEPEGQPPQS